MPSPRVLAPLLFSMFTHSVPHSISWLSLVIPSTAENLFLICRLLNQAAYAAFLLGRLKDVSNLPRPKPKSRLAQILFHRNLPQLMWGQLYYSSSKSLKSWHHPSYVHPHHLLLKILFASLPVCIQNLITILEWATTNLYKIVSRLL